eukprot:3429219-Pyramimonas_sp.AAC.1
MLGWIHTDETLSLVPDYRPPLPPRAEAFIQSVPWEDDGRFMCANLRWVRTGFGRCPSCSNPVKYKYKFAHDYFSSPTDTRSFDTRFGTTAFCCM